MRIKINGIVSIKTKEKTDFPKIPFFEELAPFPLAAESRYELKGYMTIAKNGEMTVALSGESNVSIVIPPVKKGKNQRVYWTCTDNQGTYSNYVFEIPKKEDDINDGFSYGERKDGGNDWFETVETTRISNKLSKYGGTLEIDSINDDMGIDERISIISVKIIPQSQA